MLRPVGVAAMTPSSIPINNCTMQGVRIRNRIIAALLVLLCLVAMYALYLDFHCVQIGFWRE